MCLFPYANTNVSSKAYKYGITKYKCGSCPECLQEKSKKWSLRACMQAKVSQGMMITLTYDTYKNEQTLEENPVDTSLHVSKSHLQRFFKRLRYYYPDNDIKYIGTAEYGKRTHRAHYHCVIFGLTFDDLRFYKRSKRGNIIYKSRTLEKIWKADKQHNGGICTVDSVNINASVARYCTKYCAKDAGIDDTFMLFSRGIGEEELLKNFNGKSYWIDGREYPIPKSVWTKYIESRYNLAGFSKYLNFSNEEVLQKKVVSYSKQVNYDIKKVNKYIEKNTLNACSKRYFRQQNRRDIFANARDNDILYRNYIRYWKRKTAVIEKYRPSSFARILALPDDKYRSFKVKSLIAFNKGQSGLSYIPPRSNCMAILRRTFKEKGLTSKSGALLGEFGVSVPCHNTPNDRIFVATAEKIVTLQPVPPLFNEKSPFD